MGADPFPIYFPTHSSSPSPTAPSLSFSGGVHITIQDIQNKRKKESMNKMQKLVNNFYKRPSIRKRHLKKLIYMNEADVDAYIDRMQQEIPNEPKVANCLLRWLELKKKYSTSRNPLDDEVA